MSASIEAFSNFSVSDNRVSLSYLSQNDLLVENSSLIIFVPSSDGKSLIEIQFIFQFEDIRKITANFSDLNISNLLSSKNSSLVESILSFLTPEQKKYILLQSTGYLGETDNQKVVNFFLNGLGVSVLLYFIAQKDQESLNYPFSPVSI